MLATATQGEYEDLPLTTLSDVYEDSTVKQSVFKTRFFVIKVTPEKVGEFVEDYTAKEQSRSRPVYKVNFIPSNPF